MKNKNNEPVHIISDLPEKKEIFFGFEAYAKTFAELIAYRKNRTPIVIGIYGKWGTGKTTLMEKIICRLSDKSVYPDKKIYRECKTVWFCAWKYKNQDNILAALIEELLKKMANDGFFKKNRAQIKELKKKINTSNMLRELAKRFTGIDINRFFEEPEHKKKLGYYNRFDEHFDELLQTYLNNSDKTDDCSGALVIFIDNLDRCPSEKIINILETIKLFMDKKGCIFVIGAAKDILEKAIAKHYGEEAKIFMEKIVQVAFNIPQIDTEQLQDFIKATSPETKNIILPHLHLILPSLENNPGKIKRFLNNINLQKGILKNIGININAGSLILFKVIEEKYPGLYNDIKQNIKILYAMQKKIEELDKEKDAEFTDSQIETIPEFMRQYLINKELVKIIRKIECEDENLRQIIGMKNIIKNL